MTNMGWWASAVRELSEDTLEQVTSGLGSTRAYATNSRTIIVMHDMAVAELGRRSREATTMPNTLHGQAVPVNTTMHEQGLPRTGDPYPRV